MSFEKYQSRAERKEERDEQEESETGSELNCEEVWSLFLFCFFFFFFVDGILIIFKIEGFLIQNCLID